MVIYSLMIIFFKEMMNKITFGHFSASKLTRFGLAPKNAETPALKISGVFAIPNKIGTFLTFYHFGEVSKKNYKISFVFQRLDNGFVTLKIGLE
jgi:hypothetical protein